MDMDRYIYDESNGLWYELHGEVYLPIIEPPSDELVAQARASEERRNRMRRRYEEKRTKRLHKECTIASCEFNIDTACVEVRFDDSSMLSIDCTAVENEVADNRFERSELDYLIYNDPLSYAKMVLSGDIERYLHTVIETGSID